MKFLVTILASFILFLSMKPGLEVAFLNQPISDAACCKGECTNDVAKNESDSEEDKTKSTEKSCNPFQHCCNGKIICQVKYQTVAGISEICIENNFPLRNFSFLSNYNAECWHPPQL